MQTAVRENLPIVFSIAIALFLFLNFSLQSIVSSQLYNQTSRIALVESKVGSIIGTAALSEGSTDDFLASLIPQGIPETYGEELGVSFDKPIEGLAVLKQFDPTYGSKKIKLEGELMKRYINIGMQISCEYCCGAKTLVFSDGRAACGCAHSWAMRGLAAYLLENHSEEYTDDQVLGELTKWKTLFFPKQTIAKAIKLAEESGSTTIDPKLLNEIPEMVGGC